MSEEGEEIDQLSADRLARSADAILAYVEAHACEDGQMIRASESDFPAFSEEELRLALEFLIRCDYLQKRS